MKKLIIIAVMLLALAIVGTASAKMKGEKVFDTKMGKVTFSWDNHLKVAKVKCNDCHKGIFEKKAGAAKNPAPHKVGQFCGACHDGTKAFSVKKACKSCHVK